MKAVKRMLPKGPLAKRQLTNLRVYIGNSHPHDAQDPSPINVKEMNFTGDLFGLQTLTICR